MKEYEAGQVSGVSFAMPNPSGGKVGIRLPANFAGVYEVLRKQVKRPNPQTQQRLHDQSKRTAWKLMQDWVEVQLSLIDWTWGGIVTALSQGARVIITGRIADASLTVGPAVHGFGWSWDDWDTLAAATP